MTLRDRIAAVLDRRWVLLAFCALPCAALLIADLMGRHDLENRAAALRRENLGLEMKQLASSIDQQSYELEAAVRALAENDGFADWLDATRHLGGLNLGQGPVALGFAVVMVGFIAYLAATRVDVKRDAVVAPQLHPEPALDLELD